MNNKTKIKNKKQIVKLCKCLIYFSNGLFFIQQGCQLLKIAWREEPKHEKNNILIMILQFLLRLRLSNCVSVLTLRKSDKQKCVRFYMLGGMFRIHGDILHAWRESMRNSVQT